MESSGCNTTWETFFDEQSLQVYDKDYIKTMKRWKNTSGRSSIVDDGGPGEEHFTDFSITSI